TQGRAVSAREVLGTTFEADGYDEIILLRDIPFHSLVHPRVLPFHGTAHVAYVHALVADGEPARRVVGLSKLARLVDMHARRLQLQERWTADVARDLHEVLAPVGVGVIVEARHMCMCSRGVS